MEVRLVWFEWRLAVCDMNWMFGLGGFFEFKTNFGHDCSTVRGSDQRRLLRDTINSLTVVPCGPRCYLARCRKSLSLHIWQKSICLDCIGRYWQHFCRHNRSLASVWLDLLRSGSIKFYLCLYKICKFMSKIMKAFSGTISQSKAFLKII